MSFSERDLQKKLEDMEENMKVEIKSETAPDPQESGPKTVFSQFEINSSPKVQNWIDSSKNWFSTLPKIGKTAVAIGGVWLGFSILGAVFHVVSSLVSIVVVGSILYIGYRLFTSNSDSN